jgi:tryptophan-rich sensory protein
MGKYCFGGDFLCFKKQKTSNIIKQIITYTIIFLPLVIGMTIGAIYGKKWGEDKYKNLKKPKYNPPSYVFSIVWPILYIMIGVIYSYALYDSLCIPDKISKCGSTIYFKGLKYWIIPMLALLFNFMYIPVFFSENGLYNGLIIIILSLVFAILTLIQFYLQDNYNSNIKYYAILALLPYIIWLSFATYLSYDLYMLNK